LAAGTYTAKAEQADSAGNTGFSSANTFRINAPPVVSATPASQAVQYSDPIASVAISATDADSAASSLTASMDWKKDTDATWKTSAPLSDGGPGLSLAVTGSTSSFPRAWTLSGRVFVPEGTYLVRITITDGDQGVQTATETITVTKENAYIEYSGDSFKTTDSANTSNATVNLAAVIREAGAAGAPSDSTPNALGEKLNTTQLVFSVYKFSNNTATPDFPTCTVNVVAGTSAGTGSASGCSYSLPNGDPYTVKVELFVNGYYVAAIEEATVTVSLPGTGFTTGGGWLSEPNLASRSNFGFNVKRQKNGSTQGNSLYMYRKTIGANLIANPAGGYLPAGDYNWQIKSNSWQGGGLSLNAGCNTATTPFTNCTATFSGKANITAISRATGATYSLGGNYNYRVDVTDNGEPGSKASPTPDTYAVKVWSDTSGTYYQLYSGTPPASTVFPQLPLNGGNVQVRP
jgi:hypothetical protein